MKSPAVRFLSVWLLALVLVCLPRAVAGITLPSSINGKAPEYLAHLIEEADVVELTRYRGGAVVVSDASWQLRLASAVRAATFRAQPPCLCIAFPEIRFLKGKQSTMLLTFHHDANLRVETAEVSGDYSIGLDAAQALWLLIAERLPRDDSERRFFEREQPKIPVDPVRVQTVLPELERPELPKPELPKAE